MLRCRELTERVTDHLEGKLSWKDAVRVRFHLVLCRFCRAYLRQLRLASALLSRLPVQPLSDDRREQLVARLRGLSEKSGL